MHSASHVWRQIQAGSFVKLSATSTELSLRAILSMLSSGIAGVKHVAQKLLFSPRLGLCTAVIFGALTLSGLASPLPTTAFNHLALSCAPLVDPATLRAVAAVESNFNPLAVRDNTTREPLRPQTFAAAISLAKQRIRLGHSVDIGLMQINNKNLPSLGLSVEDAFDGCRSLAAGGRILLSALAARSSESERQAAMLISLSRYNTGRALTGIANGYADQVIGALNESLADKQAERDTRFASPQWDIWGISGAGLASWVVSADGSSEILRAGAQSSDARNEGRAPASQSERGEPYEVFAYQESEASKP